MGAGLVVEPAAELEAEPEAEVRAESLTELATGLAVGPAWPALTAASAEAPAGPAF